MTAHTAPSRGAWLAWGLIVLAAAGLRFTALFEIPYQAWADEAYFEVRAREVLRGVNVLPAADPVFATGNSPFHLYATTLAQALGAPAPYSSRWVSAAMGVLGVALTFPLLWRFFCDWPNARRMVAALVGTAAHAGLYASVHLSRDGNQNPGSVAMTTLALGALFQTFETGSRRWALAAGAALALALTTYEAAYALLLIAPAYAFVRWRAGAVAGRAAAALTGLLFAAALLLFSPLLIHYLNHPEVVLSRFRMTQGAAPPGLLETLGWAARGFATVWGGLAFRGDPTIGQNLAGRPLFDPFTAALVALGMAGALWSLRRSAAAQLLLGSAFVFSLPSAVTPFPPAFTRMLLMVPALCGLAGWGAALIWGWAERRPPWGPRAAALLLAGGSLLGLLLTARDYFGVWARDPRLFDARQSGARRVAELALAAADAEDVLVSPLSQPLTYYTFRVLLEDTPVQLFDASPDCFPYAHQRPNATRYGLLPTLGFDALPALAAAYPQGRQVDIVLHPDGYAYAVFFQAPPGAPAPAPQAAFEAEFAGGLRLAGVDAPTEARPGATVTVTLHWEAAGPLASGLTGFVHIGRGRNSDPFIGQQDGPLCPPLPPERWRAGYRYVERRTVTLAADAPPGLYDLRVGVYDPASGARLAISSADRLVEDDRLVLNELNVRP